MSEVALSLFKNTFAQMILATMTTTYSNALMQLRLQWCALQTAHSMS